MTVPVGVSSNLNQPTVLREAFKEYTTAHELAFLMGNSESSAIQMKVDTSKGRGDKLYFSLIEAGDPANRVKGSANLAGNEEDMTLRDDGVTIDYDRYARAFEQYKLVDLRTPVEIMGVMRPSILDVMARGLRNDIIDAAAVTASPNRTRALFGATDANYNATLATALANVDATNDKLTVSMINTAVDKARNLASASNGTSTRKIRPIKTKMQNGAMMNHYVLLVDGVGARQLQADTNFTALRDDQKSNPISMPYFNAHDYLGMVDGAMVYRVDDLSRINHASAGASSINVSHALLLGAGAFGVGVGLPGEFVVGTGATDTDYGRDYKVGYNTIRGQKMLKFSDGSSDIENGVVHLFHSGV